ncbi:hypothetical protein CHARACLAT_012179 [Characodon lateralis]|uniref:Uncharacterized protein n=1 Tax=Characodon lateralis TaxID=208331 RepID=A0ABU7DAD1_9TELE|nr:hypothetical protein [Characodon lateralis]
MKNDKHAMVLVHGYRIEKGYTMATPEYEMGYDLAKGRIDVEPELIAQSVSWSLQELFLFLELEPFGCNDPGSIMLCLGTATVIKNSKRVLCFQMCLEYLLVY